jgi:hypothetical protein
MLVQIDESAFGKRKYSRGKSIWSAKFILQCSFCGRQCFSWDCLVGKVTCCMCGYLWTGHRVGTKYCRGWDVDDQNRPKDIWSAKFILQCSFCGWLGTVWSAKLLVACVVTYEQVTGWAPSTVEDETRMIRIDQKTFGWQSSSFCNVTVRSFCGRQSSSWEVKYVYN